MLRGGHRFTVLLLLWQGSAHAQMVTLNALVAAQRLQVVDKAVQQMFTCAQEEQNSAECLSRASLF